MKKKFLPKPEPQKDLVRGNYDRNGDWWFEESIQTFTGGMIRRFFSREREHIKIIEIERKDIIKKA